MLPGRVRRAASQCERESARVIKGGQPRPRAASTWAPAIFHSNALDLRTANTPFLFQGLLHSVHQACMSMAEVLVAFLVYERQMQAVTVTCWAQPVQTLSRAQPSTAMTAVAFTPQAAWGVRQRPCAATPGIRALAAAFGVAVLVACAPPARQARRRAQRWRRRPPASAAAT